MADFVIKPGAGVSNKLILKTQDATDVLTTSASGVTITAPTLTGVTTAGSLVLTPGSAPATTEGAMYYDNTAKVMKIYNGTSWVQLVNSSLGGVVTTYTVSATTYMVHTFKTSGTFFPSISVNVDYLVVGGGGGGGGWAGGGGGAGGFLTGTGLAVTPQSYTVSVGGGGQGSTPNIYPTYNITSGDNSYFSSITAYGGGSGATQFAVSGDGASSGGTKHTGSPGNLVPTGQGNIGGTGLGSTPYLGGGGGGKGTAGFNGASTTAGIGGTGEDQVMGLNAADSYTLLTNAGVGHVVSGARYFSGGGGGGNGASGTNSAAGGIGGGGAGGDDGIGISGTANTGGGGGGAGSTSTSGVDQKGGGNGGSGIVIIRYAI
jgi:hypothetical protein